MCSTELFFRIVPIVLFIYYLFMKLFIFGAWMNSLCMPDKLVTQGYITLSQAPFFFFGLLCVCKYRWRTLLFGEIKGYLAWAKLGHDKVNILLEEFISWPSISIFWRCFSASQ